LDSGLFDAVHHFSLFPVEKSWIGYPANASHATVREQDSSNEMGGR
jgi:hypothetical protein